MNKSDKQRRNRYPNATPEEFTRIWNESETADEVATKLSMPKPIVQARAHNYRKRGVFLKILRRSSSRRLRVEELNRRSGQMKDVNTQQVLPASPTTTLCPLTSHELPGRQNGGHSLAKPAPTCPDIASILQNVKKLVDTVGGKDQFRRILDII